MFTRLTDGIIEQSAGLFTFMVRVPDTLKQMLDQIRDGSEPEIDIQEMINAATVLANGGQLSTADEAGQAEEGIVDYDLHEAGEPPVADEEPALLEIFSKECGEHVQALHAWLGAYEEPGRVTDELYRSLHTLSGISESADMPAIGRLADGLYGWFGALYEEHLPVSTVGYEILRDSTAEIERILEALPEVVSDEDVLDMLCTRISVLPSMEQVAEAAAALPAEPSVDDVTEQPVEPPVSSEEDMALSPATPESSPQEWAGEGPAAELSEEQTDTEEAPESIEMLPADVTGSDEPLVETKTDGIVPEGEAVMQMAETAEGLPPVEKADISAAIEAPVEQAAGEAVIPVADASEQAPASQAGDPYAEIDQDLYEIFVEEATEVMDASETVLRSWSDEPDNRELMAEFQRHLHTLKGGARMVDLEAIGDLSHAVESVMTELADGKLQSSSELFGLLADAHDRLADMLDQVRNRQAITAAPDIEAVLHAVIEGGEVPTILPAAPVETISVAEVEPVTETESATAAEPVPEAEPVTEAEPAAEAEPVAEVEPVTEPEAASWPLVDEETIHEDEPVSAMPESAGSGEAAAGISTGDAGDGDEADSGQQEPAQPARRRASPPRLVIDRDQQSNARGDQVKVQSDVLDNMVNHAGEINIYRSRMEQQISDYRFNLSELDQTISRLRDQLRQLEMENEAQILYRYEQESELRNQEFDPLEMDRYSTLQQLSRSLIESISDLRSLQELMENTTRDSETLLLQQSRVSTELQENLIRTRMIPFVSLSPRLRRIARQSARQLDKKVEVELVGEDGEMDRAVVERIIAPLEHMLRNAVAHGIELPRVRKAAGKPVTGRISIEFERDGSEIVLQISDDGAGMDVEAIRERAIERGLISDDSDLPDEDVIQFVLQTGFSTASEVTQISGRGVGMDVVNSEVKQLGGSLHIESEHGKGATLTVRLPYTLAINQGMLVTAGDETFCVPLASVEGVVRFYPEE
ncbi:MAG: Hpt domain-containing protein, partial [Gammaproteobacteria bacterium]|nr:Hpt domain-containing protein [Gammaproteobacteria bacterium]